MTPPVPANDDPHFAGPVKCLACKHEWVGVWPAGAFDLDCPSCGAHRGVSMDPLSPKPGTKVWRCHCDCEVFMLTETGTFCLGCGKQQVF